MGSKHLHTCPQTSRMLWALLMQLYITATIVFVTIRRKVVHFAIRGPRNARNADTPTISTAAELPCTTLTYWKPSLTRTHPHPPPIPLFSSSSPFQHKPNSPLVCSTAAPAAPHAPCGYSRLADKIKISRVQQLISKCPSPYPVHPSSSLHTSIWCCSARKTRHVRLGT